jgi:hypothetical protein
VIHCVAVLYKMVHRLACCVCNVADCLWLWICSCAWRMAVRACRKHFELYTQWPCKAGEEFCISYGADKGNLQLMRDYGFLLPNNPVSFVYLIGDLNSLALSEDGAACTDMRKVHLSQPGCIIAMPGVPAPKYADRHVHNHSEQRHGARSALAARRITAVRSLQALARAPASLGTRSCSRQLATSAATKALPMTPATATRG